MLRWDRETVLVAALAATVSLVSFLIYFQHGAVLLYGDAVAHINIARRVFDSQTPGLLQLGTVWLPLPHLLMIPFLFSDWAWRTGAGGSIPSLIAFVFGAIGIFRLVRGALSVHSVAGGAERIAAWAAVVVYAANPNLIYLQTTAMTEPLYLALFIWAVVHFCEFLRENSAPDADFHAGGSSSLVKSGLCLLGACLTRYDGWLLAAAMCIGIFAVAVPGRTPQRRAVRYFVLLAAAGPILWLTYNAVVYRNPLEFANGPYSARAIEQKTADAGAPPHPGANHIWTAASYFLKAAQLNMAEANWQRVWLVLLLAASIMSLLVDSRLWPLMFLWMPLPFYTLSVAYGGVPIFLPVWWPFSHYNVRYGLELLPAFSVFLALGLYFALALVPNRVGKFAVGASIVALVAGSYVSVWRAQPVCFREAWVNSRTRLVLERELAKGIEKLPPDATLLMYLGDHVGALQQAGIPLRRVINEGNHRTWKQPSDPAGLWERTLANPSQSADFVVAVEGDPVSISVNREDLALVAAIRVNRQPQATIYATHRTQGNQPR